MSTRKPIFRAGGEIDQAGKCKPLREAVAEGSVTMKALVHGHYPGDALPAKTLPGLLSVGYWNAEKPQTWGLDWHKDDGLELTFLMTGTLNFQTVDASRTLQPGQLGVCGPWQMHRLGNPHIHVGLLQWIILNQKACNTNQRWSWPSWIVLTPGDLDELSRRLLYNRAPVLTASPGMVRCWEQIYKIVRQNEETSHVSHLAITINELLLHLLEMLRVADTDGPDACTAGQASLRVVQIFLDELKSIPSQLEYPWTVAQMAKKCRMSESHFTQCCRRLTNFSPIGFLNHCRVELARLIMRSSPEKSITDIAMETGFTTSQYFASVFRKVTGKSPREYREQNAENP